VRIGSTLGLTKVRLDWWRNQPCVAIRRPGGEMLRAIPEISEIAMMTNAARLESWPNLKEAGLNRVNISLPILLQPVAAFTARFLRQYFTDAAIAAPG